MRPQVMGLDEQECLHGDVKEAEMGIDEWRAARDRDRAQREAKWAQQKESAGLSVEQVQSANENDIGRLTTITTVVEYILWGLLGLTILGSAIAATRTQTSICGKTIATASTCESHPYIIPSIAAAVIATAFYLFAIAIMRAIRLWAQRIAAGLPV